MLARGPSGPWGAWFQKGLGSPGSPRGPGLPASSLGALSLPLCRPWMLFLRKAASGSGLPATCRLDRGGAGWIQVRLPGPGQLMGWGEPGERSVAVRGPEPRRCFRKLRVRQAQLPSQAWEDMNCGLWCRRVRQASRAGGR